MPSRAAHDEAMRASITAFTALSLVVAPFALGCSGAPESESLAAARDAIINGELDTEHQAVAAIFASMSACTGTVIQVSGGSAYVLTAAHCFGNGPIEYVVLGDDYQSASAVLNVVDYQVHPLYDDQQLVYDFAMIRAVPAGPSTPFIPVLTPEEDFIAPGTALEHVGYGLTSYPNGSTTQRHHGFGSIDQLDPVRISYQQPTVGPCSGDSGGPNLVDTPSGERVAGVVSYGDQECKQVGVSGRVTTVYKPFILPFLGGDPGATSATTASTGAGPSTTTTSGGATTGVGGAAPGGWVAGDLEQQDYDGQILMSQCAALPPASASARAAGAAPWLVLWASLGVARLRRRPPR